ncbi:MAG: copper resistance protein NlpE [Bacteroidia bacterium]|nr:copper resistance protein NlpE [Bacteroidia bacterium]
MKTIKIIAVVAVAALLASCDNKQTTLESQTEISTATENKQASAKISDIYGTYEGLIPAPNTAGISTHLTINSDETFTLTREYQGNKQGTFQVQGRYVLINENVIELTDKKGVKTYYRVQDGSVILSDPEGKVFDEDFAAQYQLIKI